MTTIVILLSFIVILLLIVIIALMHIHDQAERIESGIRDLITRKPDHQDDLPRDW